jgi:hypothetical protein
MLEQEIYKQMGLMGLSEVKKLGWTYEKLPDSSLIALFKEYLNLKHMRAANNTLYKFIIDKRPHLKNIMFNLLSDEPSLRRKHIPWEGNWGKTFKIFYTPETIVVAKKGPMASIITPESPNAWNYWEELSFADLWAWMENWDEVQKYLPDEKYDEIIRAMEKYK